MKAKVSVFVLVFVLTGLIILPTLYGDIIISKSFSFKSIDDESTWGQNDTISFKFNYIENDTVSLGFFFRINQDYNEYSNLFLFSQLINTNSHDTIIDTLEFQLYDSGGNCLGSGPSGIKTFKKNWKRNFPLKKGDYLLNIIHGMRIDSLRGFENIGFKIKK